LGDPKFLLISNACESTLIVSGFEDLSRALLRMVERRLANRRQVVGGALCRQFTLEQFRDLRDSIDSRGRSGRLSHRCVCVSGGFVRIVFDTTAVDITGAANAEAAGVVHRWSKEAFAFRFRFLSTREISSHDALKAGKWKSHFHQK
jgi:hypothetical protein